MCVKLLNSLFGYPDEGRIVIEYIDSNTGEGFIQYCDSKNNRIDNIVEAVKLAKKIDGDNITVCSYDSAFVWDGRYSEVKVTYWQDGSWLHKLPSLEVISENEKYFSIDGIYIIESK